MDAVTVGEHERDARSIGVISSFTLVPFFEPVSMTW